VWRVLSKKVAQHLPSQVSVASCLARIPASAYAGISLKEETVFTSDLLPIRSPFALRLAPSVEYLNWRYHTGLSFVKYRLFRILRQGDTVGYVVINDGPRLLVAQCDCDESVTLAYAALLALNEVSRNDRKPRHILLTSCHAAMQPIFAQFGLQAAKRERPLAFLNLNRHTDVSMDTSQWLINFDWGDNGMRAPFLDQKVPFAP